VGKLGLIRVAAALIARMKIERNKSIEMAKT
jgi:hypothetical protein